MRKLLAAAVVGGAVVAAGCTGGAEEQESKRATAPVLAGELLFDADRQPPAPEVDGAVAGGTVRVVSSSVIDSLDPTSACCSDIESILGGLVTRSLTQYVYDPDREAMVLIPDLATDLGHPNDDYTEWTFTIRDGVRFEDGTEVTAEDVAYGVKRTFDIDNLPGGWGLFSKDNFLHGNSYDGPYLSGTSYDGVVVDGDAVILKMAKPFPELPYYASFVLMGPIPEVGSSPDRYRTHPLATGPYRVASFDPKRSLTLVRNTQWDPATDPGRHQYPDRFEFSFGRDQRETEQKLIADTGRAQTTLTNDPLSNAAYDSAQRSSAGARVVAGTGPCTFFVSPDNRTVPEVEVRQAMGYAFPYEEYWRARGEIPGVTRLPASSLLPPGVPGRIDKPVLATGVWASDPDKARDLLAEAGFEPGEYRLRILYHEDAAMKVLVAAYERAGFKVNPYPAETDAEYQSLYNDPGAPIDVRLDGWCPAWPSGSSWIPALYGEGNNVNFQNDEVDREIAHVRTLPLDEQLTAWGELERKIQEDFYPRIITGYGGVALLHGSRIGGMELDNVTSMPSFEDLYVSP